MSCLDIIFCLQSSISYQIYKPFQHNQTSFAPQCKQRRWIWFFLDCFPPWTFIRANEKRTVFVWLHLFNHILLLKWAYERSNSFKGHSHSRKTNATEIKARLRRASDLPKWEICGMQFFSSKLDYVECSHDRWWKSFP